MVDNRDVLIYYSIKNDGDWDRTFYELKTKLELPSDDEVKAVLSTIKSKILTFFDKEYPAQLVNSYKPPLVLYYYGDISLLQDYYHNISVVGTRKPSEYGKRATEHIIKDLKGITIISGMAKGIDTIAHQAAINAGLKTVAVLGCGIDYCYPAENRELYELLKEKYLVISEYPNMIVSDKYGFPKRNRIIAALSRGTLVGEAYSKSGTSITVSWTISQGRDLYCIPYPFDRKSLCNDYIKHGAYLVESGKDILNLL